MNEDQRVGRLIEAWRLAELLGCDFVQAIWLLNRRDRVQGEYNEQGFIS